MNIGSERTKNISFRTNGLISGNPHIAIRTVVSSHLFTLTVAVTMQSLSRLIKEADLFVSDSSDRESKR